MIEYLRNITDLDSVKEIIANNLSRFFTLHELENFKNEQGLKSLSARYSIKKLIIDHFNQQLNYQDIEILNNDFGKPEISIPDSEKVPSFIHNHRLSCSLSHSRNYIAVLIAIEKINGK